MKAGTPGETASSTESVRDEPIGRRHGWFRHEFDATALLSVYLLLLFAIPSRLIIAPLGGAGSPALLIGFASLIWWGWYAARQAGRHRRGRSVSELELDVVDQSRQGILSGPVTKAGLGLLAAFLLSFATAMTRPISPDEHSTAVLGLLSVAGWLGLLLLASSMIISAERLGTLVDRIVLAGGLLALLGLLQFFTHQVFTDYIQIPGLSATQPIYGIQSREGFTRPSGTAVHPIEFGVVLTTVLPIALGRAISGTDLRAARRYLPALIILLAVLLSVSRSALVCAAVGVIVCIPSWPRRVRMLMIPACGVFAVLVFLTVPGMLGSIVGLFSGIGGGDTSSQSRVDAWPFAISYFSQSPIFGRGFATFLPKYHILDNQLLLLLVETGVVGLAATLGLLVTSIRSCLRAARSVTGTARVLPISVVGAIAAAGSSLALFDGFSFPMVPGLLFLLMGVSGALPRCAESSTPAQLRSLLVRSGSGPDDLPRTSRGTA